MLKRMILVAVALISTVLVFGLGASAQSDSMFGLTSEENVIVRAGPDFAYAAVARLPRNASVEILGRAGDFFRAWDGRQWVQVRAGDGSVGWIYARLLRTSRAFNSIPPTGRLLPRDANGRVPDGFDLSTNVCDQWQGEFTLSGNFMAGDTQLVTTYPTLQGANVYSVITIAPSGNRTAFDSETGTAIIELDRLPFEGGTYTWRVVPYWTTSTSRFRWQQVCLLRTGGTFEKPFTGRQTPTPEGE
ncbi:MAG: SH3 domain-containing protein [Chloroflexi bacterium]|nr:SH3 domain-containing protein [Chloroflexota bacterium]